MGGSVSTRATNFELCSSVQGVQFTFRGLSGHLLRAMVLSEVLEARFGARSNAAGWLEAFVSNEQALVKEARRISSKTLRTLVIIADCKGSAARDGEQDERQISGS